MFDIRGWFCKAAYKRSCHHVDASRRLEEHSLILVNRMTRGFLSYLHSADIFSPFLSFIRADNDAANLLVNARTKRRIPVVSFRILRFSSDTWITCNVRRCIIARILSQILQVTNKFYKCKIVSLYTKFVNNFYR